MQLLLICIILQLRVIQLRLIILLEPKPRTNPRNSSYIRHINRTSFLSRVIKDDGPECLNQLRLNSHLFKKLCDLLVDQGGLTRSKNVDIAEKVALFLYTIGHNKKNRVLQLDFCRSGETISRHIHEVLRAILKLHPILLRKPEPITDTSNDVNWKHFKGCIGALDGTHVKVRVQKNAQVRFRDRKGNTSINVLGVCNPNLEFIYCLSGWEGSAHDGRVLRDALSRPNGLNIPKGNIC
ncbi:hypothetical protein LINPERPRIM_LOCUS37625 [Linum perenne]